MEDKNYSSLITFNLPPPKDLHDQSKGADLPACVSGIIFGFLSRYINVTKLNVQKCYVFILTWKKTVLNN